MASTSPSPGGAEARGRSAETAAGAWGRVAHLDGLRGLACLLVVVEHSLQEVYWGYAPGGRFGLVAPLLHVGHYAVLLFIALSGYCLMLPVLARGGLRGGVRNFYAGRARRILPAYYAAAALALSLIVSGLWRPDGWMDDLSLDVTRRAVLAKVLLVHNLWPPPFYGDAGNVAIASVLWTIAVETQIYLVFPAMLALRRRVGDRPAFAAVIVLGWVIFGGLYWSGGSVGLCLKGLRPHFYGMFAVGALAATSRAETQGRVRWPVWATLGLAGFPVLLYGEQVHGLVPRMAIDAYCFAWFYAIFRACEHRGAWQRFFAGRPLASVGIVSYSIYLLHLPILAMLSRYALPPITASRGTTSAFLVLLGLALATTLPAAWAFAQVFEFPELRRKAAERLRSMWAGSAADSAGRRTGPSQDLFSRGT
jgi:peptidoglycan/LPS O-acetylase OafA/YrhL